MRIINVLCITMLVLLTACRTTRAAEPQEAAGADQPQAEEQQVDDVDAEKDAAEADEEKVDAADQPLNVWAEQIVYEEDSFTCTGSVVIVRGESRIECDKVIGIIGEVEKKDEETEEITRERAITHLTAYGSPITMVAGTRRATCLKAVYDLQAGTVTLTGSEEEIPTLIEEQGRKARSEKITFFVNEDRVVLDRGSQIQIDVKGDNLPTIIK